MHTQCDTNQLHFQGLGPRKVVGDFEGGTLTSDAGGLLLRELDLAFGIMDCFTECFTDYRDQEAIEHPVRQLVVNTFRRFHKHLQVLNQTPHVQVVKKHTYHSRLRPPQEHSLIYDHKF